MTGPRRAVRRARDLFIFVSRGRGRAEAEADIVSFRQLFEESCQFRHDRLASLAVAARRTAQVLARAACCRLLDFFPEGQIVSVIAKDTVLSHALLWSPYVMGQTICIFILSFVLLSIFFPRVISAVGDWMSAILPHMVWP